MSHVGRCQMANMFLCVKRSLHSRDAYFHRIRVYALVSAHRRLIEAELEGLSEKQLDFHDTSSEKEWMWWSFRTKFLTSPGTLWFSPKNVLVIFCGLWGMFPSRLFETNTKWDRVLDTDLFWEVPDVLANLRLGISWLTKLVAE